MDIVLNNFYKALDSIIPGGTLEDLDKGIVLNRNLYLTRISMDGLQEMYEYSRDERLYKHLEFEPFKNIDETRAYLQKLIDRMGKEINGRKYMYWFIRLIQSKKIIGSIGLADIDVDRGSATWGYAISPEHWGHGYILEAQLLIINYFFEVLKMNRFWGVTLIDNEPTISSVLAAGFQKEGILREYYRLANGERKDGYLYSLLAKDYDNDKKRTFKNGKNIALTLDRFKKICASSLKISESKINNETNMDNLSEWDSLSHVELILLIEKETGFKFKPSEIAQATSVKSILAIVNNHTKETIRQC